jgi:hypothetical protein
MLACTAVRLRHLSLFSHLLQHRGMGKEGQPAGDDNREEDNKAHSCSRREGKSNAATKVLTVCHPLLNLISISHNLIAPP